MSTSASPKAKRAHDDSLAAEEYTVQKKKQARALTLCNDDGGLHEVADNGMMALRWTQQTTVRRMWRMHRMLWTAPSPLLLLRIRSSWASSALSNGLLCSRQQRRLATMSPLFSWRALLFIFLIGRWLIENIPTFPVQALMAMVGRLAVRCE